MIQNAGQLASTIKTTCKMDVVDIGDDDAQQSYIYQCMNLYLWQYAKKIRVTRTSDAIAITPADDYVTFTVNGQPVVDMYEPYQMLSDTDKAVSKRTSFDATSVGWYREDAFSQIHVRGLDGEYRLKYIKYPEKITIDTQIPELEPAAYSEMISWVCGYIKRIKNFYQESQAMFQDADSVRLAASKAALHGMGTNAQSPGPDDAKLN